MGLFDALLGKRKVKGKAPDRLFALTTAHITLETEQGIRSRGASAIVFQPLRTGDFQTIVAEVEEVLKGTGEETGSTIDQHEDTFGYRWTIVRDPDVEDLVVGVNAVKDALDTSGYGDRVLAAVFAFRTRGTPVYFIYNVKRGSWYPFVPAAGEQARDNEKELRLKAQVGADLPIEPEITRWFPLWDVPL